MRVLLQPAYILHHRPYRDTSRILEVFTRDFGRLTLFARGARANRNRAPAFASMLQPFQRLLLSWSARGEAGQLTGAELDGLVMTLPSDRLVSGFYLNELLLQLLTRHDTHAEVFELYDQTIHALRTDAEGRAPLRRFEKRLLDAVGYGLTLDQEASGAPVQADASYHYRLEHGLVRTLELAEGPLVFGGATLLAIAREEFHDRAILNDARRLLKAALERVLDGRELKTRQVLRALRDV